MLKKLLFIFVLLLFWSCQEENKLEQEIAKIPVEFQVERFEEKFASLNQESLPELKREYPFLFPKQFADSIWIKKKNDSVQQALSREVKKAFPDFLEEQKSLKKLFQHLKFYFPEFETPRVITITSDVDYTNKIVLADSLLLISLDNYLGPKHRFYTGIPAYIHADFRKEQLIPDIAFTYAKQLVPQARTRMLLASMIYYGKIHYVSQKLLPNTSKAEILSYSPEELTWAEKNEEQVWRYFIERELLYETDGKLKQNFINISPFTKFGLTLDSKSPPQLGQYIGFQIVNQFMEKNPEVSLKKLLRLDAEQIFDESNYKPKRN